MKKSRFTLIDAGIILCVIAVLAFGIIKLKPSGAGSAQGIAEITVLVSDADKGVEEAIAIGDKVSLSHAVQAYGEVTEVISEPYKESEFVPSLGRYVTNTIKDKNDLKIKLSCAADISDSEIKVGELAVRVGNSIMVNGKGYVAMGYVIGLEER